ncbi:hypothetical protein SNE25_13690 [Mucilaginibacter sabulilitoris]|uniref:Uncharacterized protein n=1 Tax=Mucilaginibacter sabulilitoris TaxID=1173583 RepID=A0ABZ0TU57_9SPHI|nr:hypothetical protein [Mucilaginibacter sabulilitoris]WPU96571.1 hypothetical protein SNE25_13690 [Mucilaginibacter sabulilitoris]
MSNEKIIRPEWVPSAYQHNGDAPAKPKVDNNTLLPGKGIYKREKKKHK